MTDRFDLEQQLLDLWKLTDELDLINTTQYNKDLTKDELFNLLQGLVDLYNLKFDRAWNTFETCVKNKQL